MRVCALTRGGRFGGRRTHRLVPAFAIARLPACVDADSFRIPAGRWHACAPRQTPKPNARAQARSGATLQWRPPLSDSSAMRHEQTRSIAVVRTRRSPGPSCGSAREGEKGLCIRPLPSRLSAQGQHVDGHVSGRLQGVAKIAGTHLHRIRGSNPQCLDHHVGWHRCARLQVEEHHVVDLRPRD